MPATRSHRLAQQPLDLDLETAPDKPPRRLGYRGYVGGVLYIEGIIVLVMGLMLMTAYWPPIRVNEYPPNPVSRFGLWMVAGALIYMVVVGILIFVYNLRHPLPRSRGSRDEDNALVWRARRYASMKRRTRYIFDNTICCQKDAEEAQRARDLY